MRHLTASQKIAQLEHRIARLQKMGSLTPREKKELQSALALAKKMGFEESYDLQYLLDNEVSDNEFHDKWHPVMDSVEGELSSTHNKLSNIESEIEELEEAATQIDLKVKKAQTQIEKAQKKKAALLKKTQELSKKKKELEAELDSLNTLHGHLKSFD